MATIVEGDMYYKLDGQLLEIKRQLRQSGGYPFDPSELSHGLQEIIEGRFGGHARIQSLVDTSSVAPPPVPRPHIEILRERPKPCAERKTDELVADMKEMYRQLEWTFTESGLAIPERRKGLDRLLVIGSTLTNNKGFEANEASYPSWRYNDDLDIAVPTNERYPSKDGAYAIWVRDSQEPDEKLLNLSANMIAAKNPKIKTITLLEREVHELVHVMETGRHLDQESVTLCLGSRCSGGFVPNARWRGGRFRVCWDAPDDWDPILGVREVVSL
ncbi:MAG: hypothetical protein NTZ38_03310 [Candidatus Taylorbacteria bacterium]|nr:hypothetical protein [Candidatus Taylorbacteria bacterium]